MLSGFVLQIPTSHLCQTDPVPFIGKTVFPSCARSFVTVAIYVRTGLSLSSLLVLWFILKLFLDVSIY